MVSDVGLGMRTAAIVASRDKTGMESSKNTSRKRKMRIDDPTGVTCEGEPT